LTQGLAANFQDLHGSNVVPVVQYIGEDVAVGARRDRLEEVSTNHFAAICYARRVKCSSGLDRDCRQIEEDTAQLAVSLKDRRQQGPAAATYIGDGPHPREVIAGGHAGRECSGTLRHGGLKSSRALQVAAEIFEQGHSVSQLKA
jgi:hypothetical protein